MSFNYHSKDQPEEKYPSMKSSSKTREKTQQRLKDVNSDSELNSKARTAGTSNILFQKFKLWPGTSGLPKNLEGSGGNSESSARQSSLLISKVEKALIHSKYEMEILLSSPDSWKTRNALGDIFDKLKKTLTSLILTSAERKSLDSRNPSTLKTSLNLKSSTGDMKSMVDDLNKSKTLIKSLQKDLSKKLPLLSDYESQVKELQEYLELERSKNEDLSLRLSKIEVEKNTLLNTNNSLINSLRNNSKMEIDEILEISRDRDSESRTPKQSFFPKQRTSIFNQTEQEEMKLSMNAVSKENEELKRNLELIMHNYDNLCGKLKIQKEQFDQFRNQPREAIGNLAAVRQSLLRLVAKVCRSSEIASMSYMPDGSLEDIIKNIENQYMKEIESHEITKFLLEKVQEDSKNLMSKIDYDIDYHKSKEAELQDNFEKELQKMNEVIKRKIAKNRANKEKLKEVQKALEEKLAENRKLMGEVDEKFKLERELHKINEINKENVREIQVINQENEIKAETISAMKKSIKDKESDILELKKAIQRGKNEDNEKDSSIFTLRNALENCNLDLESCKKALADTEESLYAEKQVLKEKDLQLSDLNNKLRIQISINQKVKDTISNMRNEIIENYQAKLEEKEKALIDLQEKLNLIASKTKASEDSAKALQISLAQKEKQLRLELESELQSCLSQLTYQNDKLASKLAYLPQEITENSEKLTYSPRRPTEEPHTFTVTSELKDLLRNADKHINTLLNAIDHYRAEAKSRKTEFNSLKSEHEKQETNLLELSKKIAILQSSLKVQESLKAIIKEKYDNQKEILSKYEQVLIEKDNRYKDLSASQQDSMKLLNESLVNLKSEVKNKYKSQMNEEINKLQRLLNEKESELLMNKTLIDDLSRKLKDKEEKVLSKNQEIIVQLQARESLEDTINELSQFIEKFKAQNMEDENTIYQLNEAVMKLEAENEILKENEKKLKESNEGLMLERNETLRNLQHTVETFNNTEGRFDEGNSDSLEEDAITDSEKIKRLFNDLREKEQFIKKNNKRIMELQWKNRDLIDTIKEYEEKMIGHMENAEKLAVDCENLNQELAKTNNAHKLALEEKDEIKVSLIRKDEAIIELTQVLRKSELAEEAYKKVADHDKEEIRTLHSEIQEFQHILTNFSEENSNLLATNKTLNETIRQFKEQNDALQKEKVGLEAELAKNRLNISSKDSVLLKEKESYESVREIFEQEKLNLEDQIRLLTEKAQLDSTKIKNLTEALDMTQKEKKTFNSHRSLDLNDKNTKLEFVQNELNLLRGELKLTEQELLESKNACDELRLQLRLATADVSEREHILNEKLQKACQDYLNEKIALKKIKDSNSILEKEFNCVSSQLEKVSKEVEEKDKLLKKFQSIEKVKKGETMTSNPEEEDIEIVGLKDLASKSHLKYKDIKKLNKSIKMQYEKLIEELRLEIDILSGSHKSSNKSIWGHIDTLNKQLEEKTRILIQKEEEVEQLKRRNNKLAN